ncbi:MAG TPA: hypothetical protein VFW78_04675 [Bacteroidia bacterium]|nr:hypothetical protein [Bacteroidia bacterium]
MTIADQIRCSIDDFEDKSKFESALTHALTAVDGTASKLYPNMGNRKRYIRTLRDYYWIIEPAIGSINLKDTKFPIELKNQSKTDLAEIIYEIFRCNHAHGSPHPNNFTFGIGIGHPFTMFTLDLENKRFTFPDRILPALWFVSVLSKVNKDQATNELQDYYLTLNDEKYYINELWGIDESFKSTAGKYNETRVILNFD